MCWIKITQARNTALASRAMLLLKRIKYSVVLATMAFYCSSCHKVTVGYLITEYASYQVDSMVVKSFGKLDISAPVSYPNPMYEDFLALGFPPDVIQSMGIFPTIEEGAGEDYMRHKLDQPWISTAIEGLDGTSPILLSIKHISTDMGNGGEMLSQLSVRGNGMLSLPLQHSVPPGRYKISLTFKNEGYTKSIDDIFTIIVK